MTRSRRTKLIAAWALPLAVVALGFGCSTDSPTAPVQQPAPPPGPPSAQWVLNVSVSPNELEVGSPDPATVTVDVRRADTGVAPPSGTTIVVSTSDGDFSSPGSGFGSIALGTINGLAQVRLFAGAIVGIAVITAQLEGSAGQATIDFLEQLPPLVAAFSFQNTTDNLSIQFLNESSGSPDSFLWDFGDGNTSTEEHPTHVYAVPGDYAVELSAFRGDEVATSAEIVRAIQDVFITAVSPRTVRQLDQLRISGQGFDNAVRVFFDGLLAELISKSSTLLVIRVPDGQEFPEEACDSDPFDGSTELDGTRSIAKEVVSIQVEVSGDVGSDSVDVVLRVLPPSTTCVRNPGAGEEVFVTDITPNTGPASGGQSVTITGTGFVSPLRVFFGGGLATTQSESATRIVVTTPPGVLATAACDLDGDGTQGQIVVDTLVDVVVELGSGTSHTAPGAFTYLAPAGAPCNGD